MTYEITITEMARRSERRAWRITSGAVLMAALLAGGYIYLLPLKEKVPYLVMADAYTGSASIARLRDDGQDITSSEALNRANVATFVRARESFDSTLIGDRDWNSVFTMASSEVNASYRSLHAATNPDAPRKIYGTQQAIRIKILSLQLFGKDARKGSTGATVRFQRTLFDKVDGTSRFLDNRIATIEYRYKSNLAMSDEMRVLNPLGFQVTAYRVDNDYATTPMIEDATSLATRPTGSVEQIPVVAEPLPGPEPVGLPNTSTRSEPEGSLQ